MLTEKPFDTGEVALNVAEGANNGVPLVLLHGSTRWWREWEPVLPSLEPGWHVYALDLRGHGQSGRDGERYRLADYSRDVDAFVRRGVDQPVVLVGYSLGALVSIMVAAQSPERVRALILLDPPLYLRDGSRSLGGDTNEWFHFLRQILAVAPTYEAILSYMQAMQPESPVAQRETFARILSQLAPESLDVAIRNELVDSTAFLSALAQIGCPTLIIRADPTRGGLIPDEDAEFAREHIPDVTLATVANAAHHELLNDPFCAEMLRAIEKFLPMV